MTSMTVQYLDGDQFTIEVRNHMLTVDQPITSGGANTAPTPTELFVASLASCVAFYARRYLARHQLPTAGLSATADYELGSRPGRVTSIRVDLRLPHGIPAERLDALLAVASHCTVHNSLVAQPEVTIALADTPGRR
jgi:putative redox protein